MLSKILQNKLKKEGLKMWKYWYDDFKTENYYPEETTKEQIEVIAHNLALAVVWNQIYNQK